MDRIDQLKAIRERFKHQDQDNRWVQDIGFLLDIIEVLDEKIGIEYTARLEAEDKLYKLSRTLSNP